YNIDDKQQLNNKTYNLKLTIPHRKDAYE
ncbi:MAG: hypothetical protein RLZZ388_450, partial [Bacillota bacterium]